MTDFPDDPELAGQFARLRREQRDATPAFAAVTARPAQRRSRRAPFVGLAVAVAASVAIGVVVIRPEAKSNAGPETPLVLDFRSAHWAAPTDFLLDVPGSWLLRELPQVSAPASLQVDTINYRRISS